MQKAMARNQKNLITWFTSPEVKRKWKKGEEEAGKDVKINSAKGSFNLVAS